MTPEVSDRRSRGCDESGIATVWATAWMLVFVLVGGVGLVLSVAEARQHQVDAAADLAALSAAARLQRPGEPCQAAADVATANHVVLVGCRVAAGDVVVSVRARVVLPFGLHPWVSSWARAGPR